MPRARDDECYAVVAPFGVGDTDHRRVLYRRMLKQFSFDLSGIDVHAARDEHVFSAPGDAVKTFVIAASGVAGMPPAFAVQRGCGGFRIVPVTAANVIAAETELANFVRTDFGAIFVDEFRFAEHDGLADGARLAHGIF